MKKYQNFCYGILCGILTVVIFLLIPKRGIPDWVWITLTAVLPTVSVLYLKKPRSLIWSFLTELLLLAAFAQPIGTLFGYRLESFSHDLFDYIGYLMFVWGMAALATVVQLILMKIKTR